MTIEHSSKNKKPLFIISVLILILGIFLFLYSPVIFQEGNPGPLFQGIIKLNLSSENIVKLRGADNKYLTKSKNGQETIKLFMSGKDYDFADQMGSAYFFEGLNGKNALAIHKYFSRYYSLWSLVENDKNREIFVEEKISLAEELADCLPKSDILSHEKCNELLASIVNFSDCVEAGFSIMKSNPSQCATVDGRVFIDKSNSNWERALNALNNCEVEQIFQDHSKFVSLTLKTGQEIKTYEPKIDDVIVISNKLKNICGDVLIMTE